MTPRRRAILIVALAAVFLLGIILLVLWFLSQRRQAPPPPAPEPAVQEPVSEAAPPPAAAAGNPLAPPRQAEPEQRVAAVQLAELFAERYGSYSSHGNYENLRDLLPVMSAAYRARTEAMLESAPANAAAGAYEGVTSVRISTMTRTYDEARGRARIDVALQQVSMKGTQETVSYRTLEVSLIKEGQDWKVDAVKWAS